MSETTLEFYEHLAEEYHLIFPDWPGPVFRQNKILEKLIRTYTDQSPLHILDCSCGIGTQAIGLALLGHTVHATDLSPRAVDRARQEADRLGAHLTFGVSDFRRLNETVPGEYDIVLSCDNALPHLLEDEDLYQSAQSMMSKLKPGGLLLISMRDYDHLLKEKPRSTLPGVFQERKGKRIVFQTWDWQEKSNCYTIHLFILKERQGKWQTTQHETKYRALQREEFNRIFQETGFSKIEWHFPEETGYYQPIATAQKE
ncbi:MAG: class I SAM-dependent methyltransferase [bacterium]|nr:class I SAM-dependent methyltransferase [bacterium]